MAIKVVCKCGAKFNAREELAGKAIECTACGEKVSVPQATAAAGGIGAGAFVTGILILGAAIAGCGYMIWTQQETIKELQGELDKQQSSLDAQQGSLDAAAKRVDGLKAELAAANEAMTAGQATDKKAIEEVKQQLADESTRRKSLVTDLDRLDTDALKIRSDIEQAQKERDDAWEKLSQANRDKQREYDAQIQQLQDDMATKADDQAAQDRLAAEVKRLEDARSELIKQTNQDRNKLASYDNRISSLNGQLQTKIRQQNRLQADLDLAESTLAALNRTVNPPQRAATLNTLRQKVKKMDQDAAPRFQVLTFDDQTRWDSFWFKLDTSTGRVNFSTGRDRGMIRGGPAFSGWGQRQPAGRYEIQYTVRLNGRLNDLVLVDTALGWTWSCEITASLRNLSWNPLLLWRLPQPGGPKQTQKGKWRLSVSRDGGMRKPLLVLISPSGQVYDDRLNHRSWLVPSN
jgi:hypothetical protein